MQGGWGCAAPHQEQLGDTGRCGAEGATLLPCSPGGHIPIFGMWGVVCGGVWSPPTALGDPRSGAVVVPGSLSLPQWLLVCSCCGGVKACGGEAGGNKARGHPVL